MLRKQMLLEECIADPLGTILLAEDDDNDAFLMQRALERAGLPYRLIHVNDGEQCIAYLSGKSPYDDRAQHPLPDLILLDLKMPRITGAEVLEWLEGQPELREMPVVVMSGSILPRDQQESLSHGARGFFTKPPSGAELITILKGLVSQWMPRRAELISG